MPFKANPVKIPFQGLISGFIFFINELKGHLSRKNSFSYLVTSESVVFGKSLQAKVNIVIEGATSVVNSPSGVGFRFCLPTVTTFESRDNFFLIPRDIVPKKKVVMFLNISRKIGKNRVEN